ncbi:hypothetical protein [Nannocystis punicea]|uniref:Tryptophan synthase alpha chain n=1 Tax=Nannocystis punicea TaxID=2995304 RepID=A0ABY7HHV9_9BACT|nr:hypothetical protein [Nannocystis poenicansa]WAS98672.1 hypothetical protein O0S08_21270 [Nannocystis poenicansa]
MLWLAACSSAKEPGETATEGSGNPSGDPTGGGQGHAACEKYLACVAVVLPSELPDAEAGFGQAGTCWQSTPEIAQGCVDACESGLVAFAMMYPNEPACGGSGMGTTGTTESPTTTEGTTTEGTTTEGTTTEGTTTEGTTTEGTTTEGTTTEGTTTATTDTSAGPMTTDIGPCEDLPLQPDGATCTQPSGCGCSSGKCFVYPVFGGYCGECLVDADCDGGGCTGPNPFTGPGAVCNDGGPGDGCQSDAVCSDPNNGVCAAVIEVPGIITVSTCGECQTDADCSAPTPVCAPKYDVADFSGRFDCVAKGSVANNGGCNSDAACASGHCGAASLMGLVQFGVCGECLTDADCSPGEQCVEGEADLGGGKLTGATCE